MIITQELQLFTDKNKSESDGTFPKQNVALRCVILRLSPPPISLSHSLSWWWYLRTSFHTFSSNSLITTFSSEYNHAVTYYISSLSITIYPPLSLYICLYTTYPPLSLYIRLYHHISASITTYSPHSFIRNQRIFPKPSFLVVFLIDTPSHKSEKYTTSEHHTFNHSQRPSRLR